MMVEKQLIKPPLEGRLLILMERQKVVDHMVAIAECLLNQIYWIRNKNVKRIAKLS